MKKIDFKTQPVGGTEYCTEYSCGCIYHPLAGRLRQCGVFGGFSTHGKFIKLDADANRHDKAKVVRQYPIARIIP